MQLQVLADEGVARRKSGSSPATRATLLVKLRSGGDGDAWITFVDLYTPLLYRFCRTRGLQDADARDITQQVLAIVHRVISKFHYDPTRGRFRNWLGAVTSHEITRHQRQERRLARALNEGWAGEICTLASAAADPAWIEEFNSYIFQRALERIRPEFEPDVWQAFDLTWLHDVKPREAAQQLGKPFAWIYKARYKVIQRLRQELEYLTSDTAVFHRPA